MEPETAADRPDNGAPTVALKRYAYYEQLLSQQYRYFVPEGKKVLYIGCRSGRILASLNPAYAVGIDPSLEHIEIGRLQYPQSHFIAGKPDTAVLSQLRQVEGAGNFDYVILSHILGTCDDIEVFLKALRPFCSPDTRVIIEFNSYLWHYLLKTAGLLRLISPRGMVNWLTEGDIRNFLTLSGYEMIKNERTILLPIRVWGLSYVLNKFFAKMPFFNALTLSHFMIARPVFSANSEDSVTIVIPSRNEKGNVESAISRTPEFGASQEFIFVEGHSRDGTYEEIERVIQKYPRKNIKLVKQTGEGKGDAVRQGFLMAEGNILMILDADLTVPPEDLPKFYEALKDNKGEFINGCRLIYPMEDEAMRFLNLIANKFFGLFFSWLLGQRFKDTLCGTKVLYRRHYEAIAANRHYFGDFDPFGDFDLIFGAIKLNLKVIEVPIRYKNRMYGTTQIKRFKHGLLLFRMCGVAMRKIKFM
ncbi:MAG: glycosyltransferase [Candidatus Omnitrophica bacterium]|nr:glycosyltransferase [Candidatus Omnitrophota bacterium]